jgi:hypothetical protein
LYYTESLFIAVKAENVGSGSEKRDWTNRLQRG